MIENGTVSYDSAGNISYEDERVYFRCNDGFKRIGEYALYCNKMNNIGHYFWVGEPPKCVRKNLNRMLPIQ